MFNNNNNNEEVGMTDQSHKTAAEPINTISNVEYGRTEMFIYTCIKSAKHNCIFNVVACAS